MLSAGVFLFFLYFIVKSIIIYFEGLRRSRIPNPLRHEFGESHSNNRNLSTTSSEKLSYLKSLPAPHMRFDSQECNICLDEFETKDILIETPTIYISLKNGADQSYSWECQNCGYQNFKIELLACSSCNYSRTPHKQPCSFKKNRNKSIFLTCGHKFHEGCIIRWLKSDNSCCPVCREIIGSSNLRLALF